MIYAYDQVEAMTMADKIVVLQNGVIEQVGSLLDLTATLNLFVAGFIGSLKMNLLQGQKPPRTRRIPSASAGAYLYLRQVRTWEGVVGLSEHLGSDTFFFHITCPACRALTVRARVKC